MPMTLPKIIALTACVSLTGCAAATIPVNEPNEAPPAKENTWTPQSPQTKWWLETPPCPDDAKLVGAPPPQGQVLECVTPNGTVHGFSSVWFPNGHEGTLTSYRNGVKNGLFMYWLHNHPLIEGTYVDGRKHGNWTYWFDGSSGFDMESRSDHAYNTSNYAVEHYDHGLLLKTVHFKDGVPAP